MVLEEVLSESMVFSTCIWLRRGAYMPLNMFFIKICIFDHSSQLAFLPKSIACSRDIYNPKYDDHSFLSFYEKFGMNSFSGCEREDPFACQNICNG